MSQHISRRQRRRIERAGNVSVLPTADLAAIGRHPSSQAPRAQARHVSPAASRGGLVRRAKAYLARRYVDKLGPAIVAPLVAGAVALVVVGVVVGLVLGLALAAGARPGEWSE